MNKLFESNYTARLHLQPVLYACKKAILHFGEHMANIDFHRFFLNTSSCHTIYSWIDNDLFSGALTIVFHYLLRVTGSDEYINLTIGKYGRNTCRILISKDYSNFKESCEELLSLSSTDLHITDIESFQYIMDMHGGCIRLWRNRITQNHTFEINFLCVSRDGDS